MFLIRLLAISLIGYGAWFIIAVTIFSVVSRLSSEQSFWKDYGLSPLIFGFQHGIPFLLLAALFIAVGTGLIGRRELARRALLSVLTTVIMIQTVIGATTFLDFIHYPKLAGELIQQSGAVLIIYCLQIFLCWYLTRSKIRALFH